MKIISFVFRRVHDDFLCDINLLNLTAVKKSSDLLQQNAFGRELQAIFTYLCDFFQNYLMDYGYAGDNNPSSAVAGLMRSDPSTAMWAGCMMFQEKFNLDMTGRLLDGGSRKNV